MAQRMSDESKLLSFHRELESEITDHALPDGGSAAGSFRESALSEIFADELAVSGVLESPVVCHDEGGKGASSFKVNGYSVPEEDSRIDLFVTLYLGPSDEIQAVNSAHVEVAFKKLERFLGRALKSRHAEIEPGLDPYAMCERIYGERCSRTFTTSTARVCSR